MVAARPVPAGALLLEEPPLLPLPLTGDPVGDLQAAARAFAQLSLEDRNAVLDLAESEVVSTGLQVALEQNPMDAADLPDGITLEQVEKLIRIIDCNLFLVCPTPDEPTEEMQSLSLFEGAVAIIEAETSHSCAVYRTASRFNHSCAPNAEKCFGRDGRVSVRALRGVAPGEELTVSYLGDEVLVRCTARRCSPLRNGWGFECNCERCSAAEGDTLRVFRCPSCGSGEVLASHDERGGLVGQACGACGAALSEGNAAVLFEGELTALTALDFFELAPGSASAERLEAAVEAASEHLAPEHWALALLQDSAQSLWQRRGEPGRALPHLKARARFLKHHGLLPHRHALDARYRELLVARVPSTATA